MDRFESPVERAIREAQERGEFDNLRGAGKPLADLGDLTDPDWWIKGLVKREQLDIGGALPPSLALRREADGFPQSLMGLGTEAAVREVLEDFNRRVRRDRLRPSVGRFPMPIARTVDVDDLVRQWSVLKQRARLRADVRRADVRRAGPATVRLRQAPAPRSAVGRLLHRVAVWMEMTDP